MAPDSVTLRLVLEVIGFWFVPQNALEAVSATLGLGGALLLAMKSRRAGWAFVFWLFSNVGWMTFAWKGGHWFLLAQHFAFAVTSMLGIWTWLTLPLVANGRVKARSEAANE